MSAASSQTAPAVIDTSATPTLKHDHGTVPVQTRSERFKSYDPEAFPAVTGREVEWKFTPVDRIRHFFTGELDGSRYPFEQQIDGAAVIEWIDRDDSRIGRAGIPEEPASANAWASFQEALLVTVTGEAVRLHLDRNQLGDTPRAAHTVIHAEENSRGIVLLENSGPAQLNENVEIILDPGAQLTVVTVHEWDDDALHVASHFARLGHGASLKHVAVSLGGSLVRVNPSVHLASEGSEIEAFGVYFADAGQHLEHQVFINHDAPHTRSRVTYKGALQGTDARSVWIGDVLIQQTATGTDSYEENRNLLLTDGTRSDSVPNLEIETGDIAGAGHASASGRFDDEQLFYLESRGIPEEEARRLVVRGFLSDIIQKIGSPELEQRLEDAIELELRGEGASK
ncbi:Fe-S cluster assembly protein SufD [Cryobacterium sp. BB736]|uniref:Fe-S cluster assembly protein SufD n=1 Tax=Cryobacterium sp. BB736 TaxID=2746963 RepID=UPI001874E167|nr:Fe-S cluster assembly protein SufD [Cryobacterium sp. BB736]